MPKARKSKLLYFGFIGGIVLLIALALLELGFRLSGDYPTTAFALHNKLGWTMKPNSQLYDPCRPPECPAHFSTTNQYGFRGEKVENKAEGVKRILVLGDSYTAGLDVADTTVYVYQLEQLLNQGEQQYEVVNIAAPAWGIDQHYMFIEAYLDELDADVVLLVTAPNDVREGFAKRIVRMGPKTELLVNNWPNRTLLMRTGWWLAGRSSFYQYLQRKVLYKDHGTFNNLFINTQVNFRRTEGDWDLPLFEDQLHPEVDSAYQLYRTCWLDIDHLCRTRGIRFVSTVLPTLIELNGEVPDSGYTPGAVHYFAQQLAMQENVPFCDLYSKMESSPDPSTYYWSYDFHFNQAGHKWMAEELYKCLTASGGALEH